jgi:hypothetical protein
METPASFLSSMGISHQAHKDLEIFSSSKPDEIMEVNQGHFSGKNYGTIDKSNLKNIVENISVVAKFLGEINSYLAETPDRDLRLKEISNDIKNNGKFGHVLKHAECILDGVKSLESADMVGAMHKELQTSSCHNEINRLLSQLGEMSPQMREMVVHCNENLQKGQKGDTFYNPEIPSNKGRNGTFIALGKSNTEEKITKSKTNFDRLVLKPSSLDKGDTFIPAGQGCLREPLAYRIQQHLFPCGVPETILERFSHPFLGTKGLNSLCSAQMFVDKAISFIEVDVKERKNISPLEIQKLIIDLVLINTDRHLNNILVKEFTEDEYIKKISSLLNVPQEILYDALNFSNSPSDLLDQMKLKHPSISQNEEVMNMIYNLGHASINETRIYECVLIDHGGCLPDPQEFIKHFSTSKWLLDDFTEIFWKGQGRFEWMDLAQAKEPLNEAMKAKLAKINPFQILESLKKEQMHLEKKLDLPFLISPSASNLLLFNLLLVKEGAARGKTLFEIINFQREEKYAKLFFDQVLNKENPDWKGIMSAISPAISQEIKPVMPTNKELDALLDDFDFDSEDDIDYDI